MGADLAMLIGPILCSLMLPVAFLVYLSEVYWSRLKWHRRVAVWFVVLELFAIGSWIALLYIFGH